MIEVFKKILLRGVIFLTGLGGPALTFVLYELGENWKIDPMEYLIPISIFYMLSAIIAVIIHYLIKTLWICILTSTGICILTYMLFMIFDAIRKSDP